MAPVRGQVQLWPARKGTRMVKRAIVAKDRANKQLKRIGEFIGYRISGQMGTTIGVGQSMPGCLMVIGGAEDRASDCWLLQAFAELCGGAGARIVLITTASGIPAQSFAIYLAAFSRLGIGDVRELRLANHEQANSEQTLATLTQATGIFFTGGDQARLQFLVRTRAHLTLRGRVADSSLVVAGTSAGATALGPVMILGGNVSGSGADPDDREMADDRLRMGPGLGLLPASVIDVHFTQRSRLPRLVAAVTRHPSHLGIGIDEDTAVVVRSGRFEVLGRGGVVTVDAVPVADPDEPAAPDERVPGMRLHWLRADDAFDLERRHPLR
jgi:cyanophycinase